MATSTSSGSSGSASAISSNDTAGAPAGSNGTQDVQMPVATTVAPKKATLNSADTCAWYTGARCYMPRDCYDCLNIALQRDACAVDPSGMCVSMTAYEQTLARQGKPDDPSFLGFFPSANFTYCASSDDTCQQCKQQWRQQYWDTGAVPKSEVCVGVSGCICVAACEMPNRVSSILSSQCAVVGATGQRSRLITTIYVSVALFGMLLLGLLVLKAWMQKRREAARARARRERRERRRNRPPRTGPVLALTGWNSLRDKLLESEREFIEGGERPTLSAPGVQSAATAAAQPVGAAEEFAYAEARGGDHNDSGSDYSSSDEESGARR